MSNYFWTVDGRYLKKNMIEHMTGTNFNVTDDSLCLDDICISKDEISELKRLIPGYNILERSATFDSLTISESKTFLKKVFSLIIQAGSDTEKNTLFQKYFVNGLYDPKSADILPFYSFYVDPSRNFIDFQDIYLGIDNFTIASIKNSNESILEALETNNIKIDDRLIFNISYTDIQNMGINSYYISYKNYTINLIKATTSSDSGWKILLVTQNLLDSMFIKQDEIFNEKFKNELETLDIINLRNEISLTEFRSYISNLRGVSLLDGIFNLNVFKNGLFVNYYKETIDISDLTDEDIMSKIENPESFDKILFENLEDEKIYLGFYNLHEYYISLEDSDFVEIKLIYGQKNSTDIFKWLLVYIEKEAE